MGYDAAGGAHYNYGPAMVDISTLQETTNKIQSLFVSDLEDTASQDIVSATENDLGIGVTLATIQSAITSSHAEENAINSIYLSVDNRSADSSGLSSFEQSIESGNSLHNVRNAIAYSQETQNNINDIYEALYGRPADSSGLSSVQNYLANGGSLQGERSIMATSTEAANDIKGLYNALFDREADASGLSAAQSYLANGGFLQGERSIMASSTEEASHINGLYNTLFNREADASGLSAAQNYLANGGSLQGERSIMVTSTEERNDINGLYNSVFNREADASGLSGAQSYLAGGGSLQGERSIMAYSSESSTDLSSANQFILGRSASTSEISGYQKQLANGTAQSQIMLTIVNSSEFQNIARNVYGEWGQVPPTDDQLKMAGQAMYNLHSAWITTIENQSTDQLSAEAAAYNSPASSSFQDMVFDLASSATQAVGLEANLLVNTYLETTADSGDARNLLVAGGENAMAAAFDEGSVLTALKKIKKEDDNDCDPVAFRKNEAIVKNISNDTVKSANQTFGNFNGTDWNQSYKDQGIQWKTATSGTNTNQQGLPYEAWVQNQLNPSQDPNGVIWLQPLKANWKVFDHWDKDNSIATSDKTINLAAPSYTSSPYAVAARVEASVEKMLGYTTDGTKDDTVSFNSENIGSYVLNLAVPYIADPEAMDPQTAAEWKALCRAYHDALAEMSAEGKIFTFNINAVI
ncbi:DUF4214 domain-containing protein [Gluconobacter sp. P5B12]|uniref:DUF4214 domain-containing protein n=1 Tax=Gluconobacter sp. P5B12 TaxID=2762618 RepID=UPI001C052FA3|nr:hypothetical protein [Gluconobacter sp. P5B12]